MSFKTAALRSLSKVLRPTRNVSRNMSDYTPSLKEPHMNDIPVPTEKFADGYRRRNVGNTVVFVGGLLFFSFSAFFVVNSGVLYPNLTPPKKNLE